ncbi:molybdenum cofactor guanylyltransferase MobA [Gemmobacter serpentinus]|uniref:molybdenum cofactor guanylyltransferase MobA n=1 Tax=Gemmobacter serpentinus TaxID=2652247 RepID=UPI00124CA619|nr:molybdenum cofactor guanylyltransferase MobA [Gemmobacter serpentinus]
MRIFGVILAGGAGRRMGADKALLSLAGLPLASHVQDRLAPQVEDLALSANGDPARLAFTGLPVLPDQEGQGPLSGVLAGLDWAARAGAEALVTASVDTPFLPCDLVPRLWLAGDGALAVASSGGRLHPTCALWPVSAAAGLRSYLASGGARLMEACSGAVVAEFATEVPDPFMNLNTPEDLAQAEVWLSGEVP